MATISGRVPSLGNRTGATGYLHVSGTGPADSTSPASTDGSIECPQQLHQDAGGNLHAACTGYIRWLEPGLLQHADIHGDAATILHAYRHTRKLPVLHMSGSFVICIIDNSSGKCLLATDRLGKVPMFYTQDNDGSLIFSTSLQTIKQNAGTSIEISEQSIYDYLYFHVVPGPASIYRNVYKMEPSQVVAYDGHTTASHYYWTPDFREHSHTRSSELMASLRMELKHAVSRLAPFDRTGAFLSGGLDSTTVAGMMSELNDGTTEAFSIGFSEQGYDELPYARIAARHFGIRLHEYYVTADDIVDAFADIASAFDEPFGNSSAIPTYFCARLAKQNGMKRLLAGDGGDELFAGNSRYAKQKLFDVYQRLPGLIRHLLYTVVIPGRLGTLMPATRKLRSYIEQAHIPMPERMESYNYLKRTPSGTIFSDEFLGMVNTDHPDELLKRTYNRVTDCSLLNKMLYLDWKFTLADNDLLKVNKMCQLAGIEVSFPMLDDSLIEFSSRLPSSLKLKGQNLRYFYKQSLMNFLPVEIINKKKHGFGLPFGQWLKTSEKLKELIYSNLQAIEARNIFNSGFLDDLVRTHQSGHASYLGTMLWVIAMLEEWIKLQETRTMQ